MRARLSQAPAWFNSRILGIISSILFLWTLGLPAAVAQEAPKWDRWQVRAHDEVWMKGATAPFVGSVERHRNPDLIWFTYKGTTAKTTLKKSEIDRIDRRQTPLEVYRIKKVAAANLNDHACLAWNCMIFRRFEESRAEWRIVLDLDPKYAPAYRNLVEIYTSLWESDGREFPVDLADEEAGIWLMAKRNGIKDPGVFFRLGLLFRKMGLLDEAGLAFEDALFAAEGEEWPLEADASLEIAAILADQGRYEEAVKTYGELIEKNDLSSRQAYVALEGQGLAALKGRDYEKASAAFQTASDQQPENPDPKELLGCVAAAQGKLAEADSLLEEAQDLHGGSPPAKLLINHAIIRTRLGRFSAADQDLADAEALEGANGEIPIARAYLRLSQGDPEGALEDLDAAEEMRPADPYVAYLRGVATSSAGRREEALDFFEAALAGGWNESLSFRAIADAHRSLGDVEKAVKYFEYSHAGKTPAADERFRLGHALLDAGRKSDARRQIDAALEQNPNFVPAILGLGYLLYQEGDYAGSREEFERALRIDADNKYAREALARVRELADLQVWTDSFDREDGSKVRYRWDESERYGVEIALEGGRCVLSGTQKSGGGDSSRKRTLLSRVVSGADAKRFVRLEVDLTPSDDDKVRSGIRLEVRQAGRVIVFVEDSELHYAWQRRSSGNRKWETGEIGDWPEGTHTLGIALLSSKKWTFQILLDGREVAKFNAPLMKLDRSGMKVVLYAEAEDGAEVKMSLDEVRIFRKAPKRSAGEAPP
ncbi:MAG: tetratricopeptide repeat protein [Planctomycetota bacterium]|nr:tetratricopeptide repeat protein [Planctomycetota bacterium]